LCGSNPPLGSTLIKLNHKPIIMNNTEIKLILEVMGFLKLNEQDADQWNEHIEVLKKVLTKTK
jgi:hypothetical protein